MPSTPLVPLVEAIPDGIHCLSLPTPFPVGPVNCYLLLGDPLTIVDPGMLWSDTIDIISEALQEHGAAIRDLAQIVVTHGHPDHFGSAGWLASESDAVIVAGQPEAPKLLGVLDGARLEGLVASLGIPDEARDTFRDFYDAVRPLTHPIDPTRTRFVEDGDRVNAGGRVWEAHVTPGHAVGHLSLYDRASRTLLAGDHLLACITPNPVIEPDPESPLQRRRSLVEYLESLDRFCNLNPVSVLPGHGPRFSEVPMLAREMKAHHLARADEILSAVQMEADATAYELVKVVFPQLNGFAIMLGVSEIVGHLDLLEDGGALVRTSEPPFRYHEA